MGIKGKLIIAASAVVVVFVAAIVFFRSDAWALIRNKHYLPDEYEAMLISEVVMTDEELEAVKALEADISGLDSDFAGYYDSASDDMRAVIEKTAALLNARYNYDIALSEIYVEFYSVTADDSVVERLTLSFKLTDIIDCNYLFYNRIFQEKKVQSGTIRDLVYEKSENELVSNYMPQYECVDIFYVPSESVFCRKYCSEKTITIIHKNSVSTILSDTDIRSYENISTEDFDEYFLDLEQGIAPFYGEKLSLRRIEKYIESKRKAEAKQQG